MDLDFYKNSEIIIDDQVDDYNNHDEVSNHSVQSSHKRKWKKFKWVYIHFEKKLNLIILLLVCIFMFLICGCMFKCLKMCCIKKNRAMNKGKSDFDHYNQILKDKMDKIDRRDKKIKKLTSEIEELHYKHKKLKKASQVQNKNEEYVPM